MPNLDPEYMFDTPVSGTLISDFGDMRDGGKRGHHSGDLAAPAGTPVVAPVNMEVIAGRQGGTHLRSNDYWLHARDIDTGLEFRFAHTGDISHLQPGQVIPKGQQFTEVGKAIDHPHLHMQVVDPDSGEPVDWVKAAGLQKGGKVEAGRGLFSKLYDAVTPGAAEAADQGGPQNYLQAATTTNKADLKDLALQIADYYHIPKDLFLGMIKHESQDWNPGAKGTSGEFGLAQFMPETAKQMGLKVTGGEDDERWHPGKALDASARYLRDLFKQNNGDWQAALRAYNTGKGQSTPKGEQYLGAVKNAADAEANEYAAFQQGQFWQQAETQGEAIGQAVGFGDQVDKLPGSYESSPQNLFKKVRNMLGFDHSPPSPLVNEAVWRTINAPPPLPVEGEPFDMRKEATLVNPISTGQGLSWTRLSEAEMGFYHEQGIAELRGILNSYIDNYVFNIPSAISMVLTGEPLSKPRTPGGIVAGQAAGLAGQIMGPFKLLSKLTGSYLFPTPSGLRSTAYLISQASLKGGVDLGLLQGLSRVIPAAIENEDFTKWGMDVINHAESGALVGLTFPLLGAVPTKAGRLAVGFGVMDYMRAAPGKWSTLGDFYNAFKTWDDKSKKQFAELSYQYLVDLCFASRVPTFKQVYQNHSMNVLLEEMNKVTPKDAEETILGATGQRGKWVYDEQGKIPQGESSPLEKKVPEEQILNAVKRAVEIETKDKGVKFDEGLDERIAAAITEALKPSLETPGAKEKPGKGPVILETPPTVKELNPDVVPQVQMATPQELAGKGGTPEPEMVSQFEDWQRTQQGRNRDYQMAQIRAEYPGISDQQANFILEERGFGTGKEPAAPVPEKPVILGPDGKPIEAPTPEKEVPSRAAGEVGDVVKPATTPEEGEKPTLLEYAKSKLPKATADQITDESQVESYRAQWLKETGQGGYGPKQPAPAEGKEAKTEAEIKAEWEAAGKPVMHGGPDVAQVVKDLRSSAKETKSRAKQRWQNIKAEFNEFFRPGEARGAEAGRIALLEMMGKKSTEINQAMGRLMEFRDLMKNTPEAEWTRQAGIWQRGGKNNTDFDRVFEIYNEILDGILPRIREFKAISYQKDYLRQAWNNWADPVFKENLANFLDGKPFANYHDLDAQGRPKMYQATFTKEGGYEATPTGEVSGEVAPEIPAGLRRGPGGGRSLTGGRGYFKKKVISDWQTGMMLGGTPKFKNLMDLITWDLGQKLQFVHGNEFIKFGRQAGWMKWSTSGKRPADWEKINDPTSPIVKPYLKELSGEERGFDEVEGSYVKIAEAAAKGDRAEVDRQMEELSKSYDMTEKPDYEAKAAVYELYAPKEIAKIVNNWLKPGLRGREWYDLYRDVMDPLRRLAVIGPYHLRFIWNAAFAQGSGAGLSKGMGELLSGDVEAFMKTMGKGAGAQATAGLSPFIKQLQMGQKGARVLYGIEDDPVTMRSMKDMAESGGNLPSPETMVPLMKYIGKGMYRALIELQRAHPFRAIDAGLDALMEPIARGVGYAKTGGFMILDRALNERIEAKYSGEMTPERIAAKEKELALGRIDINKHLDNIYGQMNYDALLWNKSLKDMLFFAIKFPGWNIGSGRWLAAMVSGAVKSPWGKTTDYEKDALRMGLGLVVNMGITNMMLHWFINGAPPDNITDLYTKGVWTGGFTKSGNKEYIRDANYWRDAYGMATSPVETLTAKAADIWRIPKEVFVDNKEAYTGYQIRGSWGTAAQDYGKYFGKQLVPYAARSAAQATSVAGKYAPNVGWTVTPGRLTDTPAMKMMHEIQGAQAPQMVTVEKQAGRKVKRDIMAFAYERDEQGFEDALDKAQSANQVSSVQAKNLRRDAKEIMDDPQYGPLRNSFRRITDLKQAMEVFKIATPEERWALQDEMEGKWRRAKRETRYQLEDQYQELQAAVGGN